MIFGDQLWTRVRKEIEDRLANGIEGLSKGSPQTFEAYRQEVGRLNGYREVLAIADEILRGAQPSVQDDH